VPGLIGQRAWAASVREFASGIEASSARTGRLTASLAGSSRSSFTDTMAGHWEQHHKTITSLRGPMDAFADALDAAADAVMVQKGIVIGAAIALAGEVIATQGEALFTFGLAEAEVPAEVALTRTVVKIALQDLEAELIGKLINVAAADITAHLNATIRNLLGGAVSVTFEAASLKIDLNTLRSAAATVRSQAADTEETGTEAYSENAGRDLEDPGAGGRWAIVQIVEQALLSIAADLFRSLPNTLSAIQDDTAGSLDDAADQLQGTDKDLAGKVPPAGPSAETNPSSPSGPAPGLITAADGNTIDPQSVDTTISAQRQARHILGTSVYRGGGYFLSPEDAQAVLDGFHSGDAEVMGLTRTGNIRIRFNGVTGFNNNPAAGFLDQPTNIFMIKGTKSVSVVPISPIP
jgi:hypothetical protein